VWHEIWCVYFVVGAVGDAVCGDDGGESGSPAAGAAGDDARMRTCERKGKRRRREHSKMPASATARLARQATQPTEWSPAEGGHVTRVRPPGMSVCKQKASAMMHPVLVHTEA